ncbi:MAG: hypothetical protein Kilf2KO_34600 [Rhodospirillales bacterium]
MSATPRPPRRKSCTPSQASSWRTAWLIAGWLTPKALAAAEKEPLSAACRKASKAEADGSI